MKIIFHHIFKKQYKKLRVGEQHRFKEHRDLFTKNPFHLILNNHALHGEYRGYRSINVSGDLRVIYEDIDTETVQFILIGTHSNLYE